MADAYDPRAPRAAALAHGYAAACAANMKRSSPGVVWEDEAIQAVAAGLVYVGDQIGQVNVRESATPSRPTPTDSWREFLADQARQIPPGVESAVRGLTSRLTVSPGQQDWQLDGRPITGEMAEHLVSLVDWLNQLANVRQEVEPGVSHEEALSRAARAIAEADSGGVYKQALEKIAKHEEHFGSGPPDDEMREIAIAALAAGEQ